MIERATAILATGSVLVLAGLAGGCVSHTVINANAAPAIQSEMTLPEEQLLDVGVTLFDAGVSEEGPTDEDDPGAPSAEVRRAEARFMAYILKDTLQNTGNWGAVRVTPADTNAVEVIVRGHIVTSNGERLEIRVKVEDATGRIWLDKKYEDLASKYAYSEYAPNGEDPFQDLYNAIANDMLAARDELEPKDHIRIRQVSELKFASDLSPYAFDEYLQTDRKGRTTVSRLPADSDPMMARMRKIRERDYMFIDTLDEHYAGFYGEMSGPYGDWRKFTYDEAIALRELQAQARRVRR